MNQFKRSAITLLAFAIIATPIALIGQQVQVYWQGGPYDGQMATYGDYSQYQSSGSGASYGGGSAGGETYEYSYSQPVRTVRTVQIPATYQPVYFSNPQPQRFSSAYGAGYATGQGVQTVVRGGLFGLRRRVVTQDAGFMGTTKQVVRVTSGLRGQWVFFADGSRQWQWYR